jgi:hypothetical protein
MYPQLNKRRESVRQYPKKGPESLIFLFYFRVEFGLENDMKNGFMILKASLGLKVKFSIRNQSHPCNESEAGWGRCSSLPAVTVAKEYKENFLMS